jgi:hypothetical protein
LQFWKGILRNTNEFLEPWAVVADSTQVPQGLKPSATVALDRNAESAAPSEIRTY